MTNHPLDDAARFDQERNCLPPTRSDDHGLPASFEFIAKELLAERERQEQLHGRTNAEKRRTLGFPGAYLHWREILGEELGEASRAYLERDYPHMRKELVECAAVIAAMLEYGDVDGWFEKRTDFKERRKVDRRTRNVWGDNPAYDPRIKERRLGRVTVNNMILEVERRTSIRRGKQRRSDERIVQHLEHGRIHVCLLLSNGTKGLVVYQGAERRKGSADRRAGGVYDGRRRS